MTNTVKRIIVILVIMFSFSCKNEGKKQETPVTENDTLEEVIVDDNILKVNMDVIVKEDDKFQLFYIDESPENNFSADKRKAKGIKGSEDVQTVVFSLPENVLPYKFRLDLGENNIETKIKINAIKITYNNNVIDIDNAILERFFQPNIYLEKMEDGYMRKKINGKCDPFLVSKALLIQKMELEL